jgi:parallel beta-helix repeat protein
MLCQGDVSMLSTTQNLINICKEIKIKSILTIFILISSGFIGILIFSTDDLTVSGATILYVGGSGPGNYTKIQTAINNANNNDIIRVYTGTYYENVIVTKTLKIIGNGTDNTIIDGGLIGDTVKITANGVEISNFNITNAGTDGIFLDKVSNCKIFNNTCILNDWYGIYLDTSSNNTINNNTCLSNYYDGIWVDESKNNKLINNNCSDNDDGIRLTDSPINTLINNTCTSNYKNGIKLWHSSNNTLNNNTCTSNYDDGINLFSSSDNELINNTCSLNYLDGINLDESSDNTLINNTCSDNDN